MESTVVDSTVVVPCEAEKNPPPISEVKGDEDSTAPEETTAVIVQETTEKTTTSPPIYTLKDVASHTSPNDMWIVIDNEVYNVTKFRHEHPGGAKILTGVAGKDATKKFDKYHRRALLDKYKPSLRVGVVDFPEAMTTSRRRFLKKMGIGKD